MAAWLASTGGVAMLAGGVLAVALIVATFAYLADLAHSALKAF